MSDRTAMQPGARITQFDALRGIGILMVMTVHCWWVRPTNELTTAIRHMMPLNFLSIDLFFVLSGYLITGILLRSKGTESFFRTFYMRRALRILPAYYVTLLLIFLVLPILDPALAKASVLDYWPAYVLHVQNWLFAAWQSDVGWAGTYHFWSLAVEEQYYLLWPLVVFACKDHAAVRRACVLLFGLCALSKIVLVVLDVEFGMLYVNTITRMDALCAGGFVAAMPRDRAQRWALPAGVAGLALGALMPVVVWLEPHNRSLLHTAIVTSLAALSFGALTLRIHARVKPWSGGLLRSRLLVWFGERSYSLYLLHLPLFWVLYAQLNMYVPDLFKLPFYQQDFLVFVIMLTLVIPAAMLMHRWLEQPAMNMRHRLVPDPLQARQAAAVPPQPRA